jgi:hypothetical protein
VIWKGKGVTEGVLVSSPSRRGRKCSNSISAMASITSLGCIVFLFARWADSFALFALSDQFCLEDVISLLGYAGTYCVVR